MAEKKRKFGVLLHPTSFPSPFGIGDLGAEARAVLKTLADAGVSLWQVLPLGPTGYGDSPYSARSCFAGNEYLIDLRSISGVDFSKTGGAEQLTAEQDTTARVDYSRVYSVKLPLLKTAAAEFLREHPQDPDFASFCTEQAWWLDDYALYRALTDVYKDSRWFMWDTDIKNRKPSAVRSWSGILKDEIKIWKALQFFFRQQWDSLHRYANSIGLQIIGDIPIFAASDSADVWANRSLFKMDGQGNQLACAGVPPDLFSAEGQLWGNPVYDWAQHEKTEYKWWRRRIEQALELADIVRIDHFRGLEACWEVPAGSPNAVNGKWEKGPGMRLLEYFKGKRIIAEDLGVITPEVKRLLARTRWSGMKVLQFAFGLENGTLDVSNAYLPHNYGKNCVAYTGTHDNNTARGWFGELSPEYQDIVRRYFECPDSEVVWQMIRTLAASPAAYVIVPMQDIMGLDGSARMNTPATVGPHNWSWRFDPAQLEPWMSCRLKEIIYMYGRA